MPRNRIVTAGAVVALAAVAGLPAAAQAHHVAGAGAKCELVANVPTITAWASFESFASYNKPISGSMMVDGTTVETISGFTFPGSTGTWNSAPAKTTAGDHHISGSFWWPNQNGQDGRFSAYVKCPAPVPPPAPAAPTPPTPETTPLAPSAQPQGAVLGETESSAPCVPQKLGKFRITVTPKGALHGLVTFHLKGNGARKIRWYVDTRRAAKTNKRWEWTRQRGRQYSIYLWAQQRWGEHLWGRHTIEARFKVKDSCGKARAVRVTKLYFNHDPLPNDPIFAQPAH
jgi:hypothetical protein